MKHLAAPGGQQIHVLEDSYQMPLRVREGERVSSELPELKSGIERLGLRGQKALRLLLRTEVQMWHSLAACSTEMHNLVKPLKCRTRAGYPNACTWLGDVCNLTVFVSDVAHQTECDRLVDWYGEDFDRRLMKWIPLDVLDEAYKNMIEELGDRLMTESESEGSEASEDFKLGTSTAGTPPQTKVQSGCPSRFLSAEKSLCHVGLLA